MSDKSFNNERKGLSVPERNSAIISFYGADGSGKSKIAQAYKTMRLEESQSAVVIGGSSFNDWLTPQVARETLGSDHSLDSTPTSVNEIQRRFEEIAIACYGYAGHLADNNIHVAIDSDPMLKKLIWEKLHLASVEFTDQAARFGSEVIDRLAIASFPDSLVGVNMQNEVTPEDLYARIEKRTSNTVHDPANVEQTSLLVGAVGEIWAELESSQLGDSSLTLFNQRFGRAAYLYVHSPECAREDIPYYAKQNAQQIIDLIDSNK